MIAAIYARKSNEQDDRSKENTSCARQIEHASQFIEAKGWTVGPIFKDDGISGAEFAKRPDFLRLLNALKPRPPFQVLVMSESSRLGREQIETAYALKQIITAGVQVWTYLNNQQRLLTSPTEKALLAIESMADEIERERARVRVYDALVLKARKGYAVGGPCFGYDNVPKSDGAGKRSHVELRVNPTEAAVVTRIFDMSAKGTGYTRIAKLLNAEYAPAPKPKRVRDASGELQASRPPGWTGSTVKVILDRRRYLGEAVWGKTKKLDEWGQWKPSLLAESEWVRAATPPIISKGEWLAVHDRIDGVRARLEKASGGVLGNRRARDVDSDYLLSGFARCGICNGGMGVLGGSRKRPGQRVYGCLRYHRNGMCPNGLKLPMARVDDAVLTSIIDEVLADVVVEAIVNRVMSKLAPKVVNRSAGELRNSLVNVEREISNLTRAIATGGKLEPLLKELRACEKRRDELKAGVDAREQMQSQRIDRAAIEAPIRRRIDNWRSLLTQKKIAHGRQLLREMLAGPMTFNPKGRAYRFEGEASYGALLTGEAGELSTNVVPLRGFEPRSRG